MKMKKLHRAAALLIAVLITACTLLSACGAQEDPAQTSTPGDSVVSETTAATPDENTATLDEDTPEITPEETQAPETPYDRAAAILSYRLNETVQYLNDDAPVMLRSYDTDAKELSSVAFTYDNALVAMAFIADRQRSSAERLLDSLVYAVNHDRYMHGRIRNGYYSGCLKITEEDGNEIARMSGWYDDGWKEDAYQVGCNVGNTSYVVLALLQYIYAYDKDGLLDNERCKTYIGASKTLMNWVIDECSDGSDGFTAGWNGWPEEGKETVLTYKSTEHNIDAYAAFSMLYQLTGETKYKDAADSALRFIKSMYSDENGYFYTGTKDDGVTPDTGAVVLDTQVWSALALGNEFEPYKAALDTVAGMKTEEGAYPFCKENKNGGFWCEGTAFTALMYACRGDEKSCNDAMDVLDDIQLESGLFPAASVDNLDTGMQLSDGSAWEYKSYPHIAPTAWYIMAQKRFNPYSF